MISDSSKGVYGEAQNHRLVCPTILYTLYILPDGHITTCCSPPYPVILGNIQDESLVDMWNGQKRKNLLKMQLSGDRMKHSVCRSCAQVNATNFKEDDLDKGRETLLQRFM